MSVNSTIKNVSEKLLVALTQAELQSLLDALWAAVSLEQREKAIAQLSPDTQDTIRQLLEPSPSVEPDPTGSEQTPPISIAKLSQTWSGLWQEWFDLVAVAAEENGQYIEQEASWEPPYFDNYTFAEDLDAVAKKMRSHLPSAFEHGLDPQQGFATELIEAETDIRAGIPEWIEIVDGIGLGTHVTHCLLAWEWLTMKAQAQDAFAFAQQVREIETGFAYMALDEDELIGFLWELPQADQACIVEGLTANKGTRLWNLALGKTHSSWHLYYMEKLNESSPEEYLKNLRETIPQQWSNGLPIIENLMKTGSYTKAMEMVQVTLKSLQTKNYRLQDWTPETSLLVTLVSGYAYDQQSFHHEKTLLDYWQKIAEGLGKAKQVNALEIQNLAFDYCFDWSKMFEIFANISVAKKTHRALFQSWRDYVVQRATPHQSYRYSDYGLTTSTSSESGWIHWLLDSIVEVKKGAPWFQKKMAKWLGGLSGDRRTLGEDFERLRLLTHDLQKIQAEQPQLAPTFDEVVIRKQELSAPDDVSRRGYLQQFASNDLLTQVMDYWRANLHQFVPDPLDVHRSDYTRHAQWMLALKEIVPRDYGTLLATWKSEHHRRSNLWKAMAKAGL